MNFRQRIHLMASKTKRGLGSKNYDKEKALKIQSKGGKARWVKYNKEKAELEKLRNVNSKVQDEI